MLDRSLVAVTDVVATIPGLMFCVKAVDGTNLIANQAFAERAGLAAPGDVVGRTAHDLFAADLVERYEAQDRAVLATGRMLTNELKVITRSDGSLGWYLTSKSRWTDEAGAPVGVVSMSVDLRTSVDAAAPHGQLTAAIDLARRRVAERLTVGELADAAAMTPAQLERVARRLLGLSPKQLIMRFRLEEALRLLEVTDLPLAEIAHSCGYYDQSAFTRHFKRVVGWAPAQYRAGALGR